jgi:hypothetical protein
LCEAAEFSTVPVEEEEDRGRAEADEEEKEETVEEEGEEEEKSARTEAEEDEGTTEAAAAVEEEEEDEEDGSVLHTPLVANVMAHCSISRPASADARVGASVQLPLTPMALPQHCVAHSLAPMSDMLACSLGLHSVEVWKRA